MADYSFRKLSKEVKSNPAILYDISRFIRYLCSPSSKRLAKGKNADIFVNVLLHVMQDQKLPKSMTTFFIKAIFPYLDSGKTLYMLDQVEKLSPKKVDESLKLLQQIINLDFMERLPKPKGFFASWGFGKKKQNLKDETFVSSPEFEDETVAASYKKSSSSKRKKSGSSNSARVKKLNENIEKVKNKIHKNAQVEQELLDAFKEETIFSSPRSKLSPFKRLTSKFSMKVETVLSTSSPLQDSELETLRVQTLVAFDKRASIQKWIPYAKEGGLYEAKPKDFLKTIKAHSLMNLSPSAKQTIDYVKNALMIRTKLLTEKDIIVNIINKGTRSLNHTIDRLSGLTNNKKLNKKIWQYLFYVVNNKLLQYDNIFRKNLESCNSTEKLNKVLDCFELESNSIFSKYPNLKIVRSVKKIKQGYDKNPGKIVKLMNKYIGKHGEVNIKAKLDQLLLSSAADLEILRKIKNEKDIWSLERKLLKINSPTLKSSATQLAELIHTFLDPTNNKLSFKQFKAGFNSFSEAIGTRISIIARQSLQKFLNKEIQSLITSNQDASEKMHDLRKILRNPRYDEPSIKIYGYKAKDLDDKIQSINFRAPDLKRIIKHILSNKVPDSLVQIIIESKKQKGKAGQKTLENCYLAIKGIEEKVKKKQPVQIRKELVSIFKTYGMINVSKSKMSILNGYDLAQLITNFYQTPKRTTIDLPNTIDDRIHRVVKSIIDEERAKQLKKMGF